MAVIYNTNKNSNFATFVTCNPRKNCGASDPKITVIYNDCTKKTAPKEYGITKYVFKELANSCYTDIIPSEIKTFIGGWLRTEEYIVSSETLDALACEFGIDSLCSYPVE